MITVTLTEKEVLSVSGIIMAEALEKQIEVSQELQNKWGAHFALAKALNLYPKICGDFENPYGLVSRTHGRIQIITSVGHQQFYRVPDVFGDIIVVLIGDMPTYNIKGWCKRQYAQKEKQHGEEGYTIYNHVLAEFPEGAVFYELLNDSRNWTTAYEKDGDKWTVK